MKFVFKVYYSFKVDFVYYFKSLDYFYITSISKTILLKPNLRIKTKKVGELIFPFYKHYFGSQASFEDKEIFIFTGHFKLTFSLFENNEIRVIVF